MPRTLRKDLLLLLLILLGTVASLALLNWADEWQFRNLDSYDESGVEP